MREYFKACGELKKFDHINITGLLSLLQAEAGSTGNKASSDNLAALSGVLNSQIRSTAGSSPADPIYISPLQPTLKDRLWKLLGGTLTAFIVFSMIGSMMDEKGGGIGGRLGMTSSNIHQAEHSDKTFDDVVGIDEAKGDLREIVMYLKDSKRFTRLGGKLPKGVLLTGPPGTGKTLLARAIAGEAGVPFYYTSGSEFEEMFVGVGARRVRDLFEQARKKSPCIIFIDEIDAIGGSRHLKDQSAMKMTLNQLLVEMDGFEQNSGIIVIAATNFPDSLDSALVRPGRFDKHVDVPPPDIGGRKAILELYGSKIPLAEDVNLEQIARGTPGFSGAELYNLVNQAALKASIDGLASVGMQALEFAKDKIMMGAERKSAIISPETIKMTAFHEAGHALVALKTSGSDPIHKATVMPRGRALGMVMQLPDGDQTSMSRKQMLARMDVCMGGRIAEEMIYGAENITSGASNDIQQATKIAYAMVKNYGFSEKVGVMFVDDKASSGQTKQSVDEEVRVLLQESYARATKILESYRNELDIIANGLIQYESLSGGEIVDLLNGKKPNMTKGAPRNQKPSRATKALPILPAAVNKSVSSSSSSLPSSVNKAVRAPLKGASAPPPSSSSTLTQASSSLPQPNDTNLVNGKNNTLNDSRNNTAPSTGSVNSEKKRRGPPE